MERSVYGPQKIRPMGKGATRYVGHAAVSTIQAGRRVKRCANTIPPPLFTHRLRGSMHESIESNTASGGRSNECDKVATVSRMITLTTRRLVRPSTVVICVGLIFLLNLLIFTQIVFSQSQTAPVPKDSGLAEVAQVIGILTSIGFFITFLIGLVWYIWKGKDIEAKDKRIESLRDDNEDLRTKVGELKTELAEARAARKLRESEAEELRKANLRLQGIHDAE